MNQITLTKSQVFALRGQNWLFSICPINDDLFDLSVAYMDKHNNTEREKPWYKSKNYIDIDQAKIDVCRSKEYLDYLDKERATKKAVKADILARYKLVSDIDFGSFKDHEIIIEDVKTSVRYKGFCNNYGGDNSPINFIELT